MFDCGTEFKGKSINQELVLGPNLTNQILRVLLQYFWNTSVDFEMCAHLFGDNSSPSCSNFAPKKTATDNGEKFGEMAAAILKKTFCADDLLKSVPNADGAHQLIEDVINMCAKGRFNLTELTSNKKEVLVKIPEGQIEKYCFVTEGHSVVFFVHILEHGHCLNILVIGYKEFHSPFQTSIVIKIFMSNYYRNLT